MKSKEEIEQLAHELYPVVMVSIFTQRDKVDKNRERRIIFIEGYTQCQEDMDKKYTEEDMIDAIIYGSSLTTCNIKLYAHNYINSLNKQDNESN